MIKLNNYSFKFARTTKRLIDKTVQQQQQHATITQLTDRCLISFEGNDVKKVLQGVTTNDIEKTTHNNKFASLYTGFLNIKGRIIADAIVIKPRVFKNGKIQYKENQYWIDIHKELKQKLVNHIAKYSWKKSVKVSELQNNIKIKALYNDQAIGRMIIGNSGMLLEPKTGLIGKEGSYANISFVDPRTPSLGARMIMNAEEPDDNKLRIAPLQNYNLYKTLHSIVQGPQIVDKIPFQYNLDLLRGISFTKGCYIGQQLIARAYHTGVIRKRVFPFVLEDISQISEVQPNSPIIQQNKQIGKILQFNNQTQIGIALINYIDLKQFDQQLKIYSPVKLVIFNPLSQQLSQYMNHLKQKTIKQQEMEE